MLHPVRHTEGTHRDLMIDCVEANPRARRRSEIAVYQRRSETGPPMGSSPGHREVQRLRSRSTPLHPGDPNGRDARLAVAMTKRMPAPVGWTP